MTRIPSYRNLFLFLFISFAAVDITAAQPFSFIAIGDTPYSGEELRRIESSILPALAKANPPFLVHYGDFKAGNETCTKKLFRKRRALMHSYLPGGPVFYTPGDNEWTDCDRPSLDPAVSELAMLKLLRKLFFRKPLNLPANWSYARQPDFPENARWVWNRTLFATVHMVSTNNGRINILKDDVKTALALVDARDRANEAWLEEAFAEAVRRGSPALVVVTQADVTSPEGIGPCTPENPMKCDAFLSFRLKLIRLAKGFVNLDGSRRPVLLVHGDSNPYCYDKTFGGREAPNLWRLNGWGDYKAPANATVITVRPENGKEPFSAKTLLGGEVPAASCP